MRVAVIGAGISGLALAYYLQKLGIPYDLFEAGSRVGGNIRSVRTDDYLLELGPNAISPSAEISELLRELKLEDEVLPATVGSHQQFVLRDGAYRQLPYSPLCLLSNTCFSWKTRYRILQERYIPPENNRYETVSEFFERRFGAGVLDYAVNPLVSGLYAGNPDKLLVQKVFPQLKEMELEHGSVLKGLFQHQQLSEQLSPFSFVEGMQTLPEAIADKLISLHTEHRVAMITRHEGKYIVSCSSPTDTDTAEYDLLVLSLPAPNAAELLHYTFPGMAAALQNIHYPPLAVVHSVYNSRDIGLPPDGFGAMHPVAEDTFSVRSIWNSSLFSGRCRPHEVLFTTFVGGAQAEHLALTERDTLLQQVHQELKELHGITAGNPIFQYAHLWHHSIPQFDLHIEDAHEMAQTLEEEGLFIAANWYSGVSVPDCIRGAKELSCKINSTLRHAHNS